MGKQRKLIDAHFPISRKGRYTGQYQQPRGVIATADAVFADMAQLNCIHAVDENGYLTVLKATNNNPCASCPEWNSKGPACKAFQKFHTAYVRYLTEASKKASELAYAITPHNAPEGHPFFGKSMYEIAKMLTEIEGKTVGIREARRRKQAGTLLQGASV